jgi:hypothetical protein
MAWELSGLNYLFFYLKGMEYVYGSVDRVHSGWFTDFIRCKPSWRRSTVPIQSGEPLGPF